MNRLTPVVGAAVATALLVAGYAAASSTSRPAAARAPAHAVVDVRSAPIARHLVASNGRTLYIFSRDRGHRGSTCKGACARNWPPLRSRGAARAGHGVSAPHVTTIRRSDGARQVTYFGHPLYEFSGDSGPGQTHGQNLDAFGGHWTIVSHTGAPITRNASTNNAPKNVPPTY
jgi:predicted lipoprotein with Yx(FWY)xxD motif